VRREVRAVGANVQGFMNLPMLIAAATRDQAEQLTRISDVHVVGVGPALRALVPLLRGMDLMATIETLSAAGVDQPYVIGGTRKGMGGYPSIDEPTRQIVFEEPSPFNTRAARLQIVNLSVEPPTRPEGQWPWSNLDPVNIATSWLAPRHLFVFASGNQDPEQPGREITSAWAEAPWVLSVGATADEAGTELAEYSNTGVPGIPGSGPDVVAWGASLVDKTESATSYAAPKVTGMAAICASAIEQLRHQASDDAASGNEGVPLCGIGFVDTDYKGTEVLDPRWSIPAQPLVGVDTEGLRRAVSACAATGIRLNIQPKAERLRQMILAAARPMPNYQRHEVGAGFIDHSLLFDWLGKWTAKHLAWFFAEVEPPSLPTPVLADLPDAPIFGNRAELEKLAQVALYSAPHWSWDFRNNKFGMRPDETHAPLAHGQGREQKDENP
jgi:Subtilase family